MTSFVKLPVIFFLSLFWVLAQCIFGQGITAEPKYYTQENGLSSYANYIHKDSRGIIWVGTQFGLYRFDGQEFVHFDEKDGLPFREVMEIFEDTEGWFWLYKSCRSKPSCERNLAFFHPLTKEVMTFEQRFGDKVTVKASQIPGIGQDSTNIYFTADRKLLIWSSEKGIREITIEGIEETPVIWTKISDEVFGAYVPEHINIEPGYEEDAFQYLAIDIHGKLRQSPQAFPIKKVNFENLNRLRKKHFQFERLRVGNQEIYFSSDGTFGVDSLSYNLPYMSSNANYSYWDERFYIKDSEEIYHTELGDGNEVSDLYKENVYEFNYYIDYITPRVFWVKNISNLLYQQGFHQTHVFSAGSRCIFFDWKTNAAWRADRTGIEVYEYKKQPFRTVKLENRQEGQQLAMGITALNDQSVLLILQNDLCQMTKSGQLDILYTSNLNPIIGFSGQEKKSPVWAFKKRSLAQLDLRNLKRTEYPFPGNSRFRSMYKVGNKIWIGTSSDLLHYFVDQDSFAVFSQYNQYKGFQSKVHFFKKATNGYFWLGTDNGLFWCSEEKGLLLRYGNMETDNYYLPAKDFYHMSEAKMGGYWLATMNGLIHFTPDHTQNTVVDSSESITYHHYSTSEGLSNDEILAVYEDHYGFIWMPTPHGLIQFQISTALSKTYLKSDGLTHSSFEEFAHYRTEDGTLYLGGYDGFNIFHPKDFRDVELHPQIPLVILDYEQHIAETDSIEYRLKQITEEEKIVLQPGDKFFNIRVALQDYREAEKHRFRYKIEGYQEEWQEDKSNLIRISGLPYGSYTLKIKGRLQGGQLAEPGLDIPVHVLKPYYMKTQFFVFIILVFLLVIFLFYQWRVRNLKTRQKMLKTLVKERTLTIKQKNKQLKADKKIIEQQAIELRQLDKIKSRFFANVSHEFRTPLTLILGPLSSLLKDNLPTENRSKLIKIAHQNGNTLLRLVNEILDLTKLESGKLILHEEKAVFYPLVYRIISSFESHAQRQDISFQLKYKAREDLQIKLDISKFRKILNNLLTNAFKFTPKGGEIEVQIVDKVSHIRMEVTDTGRGIHADDLPHIFNRFYQSKRPNAVAEGGTGIGLALCQEYSKLFEGKLWAESEVGKGSTFIFEFPKKEIIQSLTDESAREIKNTEMATTDKVSKQNIPVSSVTGKNDEAYISNKANILLVEDNHSLRDYFHLITGENYNIRTAENGESALKILRESAFSPSLIISDIMMPIMDGFQLLEKLKSSDQWRHIPVIMLTARAELSDKLKALRIGVDDYLTKPFEEEELLVRIANLLDNAKERESWRESVIAEIDNDPKESKLQVVLSKEDTEWLKELEAVVENNQSNTTFNVERLSEMLFLSRRQLQRRIKELTGLSPHQYIQEARFRHARELLENQSKSSVKAIAYTIGMSGVKNFSYQYKKRFGKLPSDYFPE